MLGHDHALVHARVTITGQSTPEGDTAADRRTIFSFVVARQTDDQGSYWRAISAQNTDVVPGGPDTHVNAPDGQFAVRYRIYRRRCAEISPPRKPITATPTASNMNQI